MSVLQTLASASGLVDLALKSVAVMLVALAVSGLLGRASAARRHLVWCLGVSSLLLLPFLSLTLPAWQVTWLPQWDRESAESTATGNTILWHVDDGRPQRVQSQSPIALPSTTVEMVTRTPGTSSKKIVETTAPTRDPLASLVIVWAAGVMLSLVPLGMGLRQLAALKRHSRLMDDPQWQALLVKSQRQLNMHRRVQLRQSEAAIAPLTWGALRPVLLVPAEARVWTDPRRQLVLLHELAHIRRWDWLTQLVAHMACAVYWFNPLVWLAARRMRIERERACDDLVLAAGARASDYAQELLTLATRLADSRISALVAVPMTRRGALEDRVRGILDCRRSRAALTMQAVCLGLVLTGVTMTPLAMLRAAPPGISQPTDDRPTGKRIASQPIQSEPTVKKDGNADQPAAGKDADKPTDKPKIRGLTPPARQTDGKSAEKATDKPEKKPVEKPATKTVTIRGKVVDDVTGEPIKRLITQAGKFEPAEPKKVAWGYSESRSSASDGTFSTTVRWAEGWTARILADGYIPHPVLTSAPPADKDEIEVTIRLKRGPKVRGVVLDHEGNPLKDAAVFAVGPTGLNLSAGQAWSGIGGADNEAEPVRTDAQGRFELPTGESKSLAVSHSRFDAWPTPIPASGDVTVRLPEPARIDIDLTIDGADKESVIFIQFLSHLNPEFAGVRLEREFKMDNPGKFSLAALPPGKYQICRQVMNRLKEIGTGAMLERQFFELKAGEKKSVQYVREKGSRLRGKVTWPANTKLSGIVVSVRAEKPEPSPFDKHEWTTTYASQTAGEDGAFLTERIAPGKYLLVAQAYTPMTEEQRFRSGIIRPSHRAEMRIEVGTDGELMVPDLVLKPGVSNE